MAATPTRVLKCRPYRPKAPSSSSPCDIGANMTLARVRVAPYYAGQMTGPRATPRSFTRRLAIETPESVVIELELAGIGSRFAAAVYDSLVIVLLLLVTLLV